MLIVFFRELTFEMLTLYYYVQHSFTAVVTATLNERHVSQVTIYWNVCSTACSGYNKWIIKASRYWPLLGETYMWMAGFPHKAPRMQKVFVCSIRQKFLNWITSNHMNMSWHIGLIRFDGIITNDLYSDCHCLVASPGISGIGIVAYNGQWLLLRMGGLSL